MKIALILFASLISTVSLADTWYGYCIAEGRNGRTCTTPEIKTDDLREKCIAFAENLGASKWAMESNTDLSALQESQADNCDRIQAPDQGAMFACQYSVLCPNQQAKLKHFANQVYAVDEKAAIDRCATRNATKIGMELRKQSAAGCFLKLVAEPLTP